MGIVPFAAAEPADDANITAPATAGIIRGVTLDPAGEPLAEVRVAICNINENTPQMTLSGNDGKFLLAGLKPGQYQITAQADGYETELPMTVEVTDQQSPNVTVPPSCMGMSLRMPPLFMNTICAPPVPAGASAASCASAITSPNAVSPAGLLWRVSEAAIAPMTRFSTCDVSFS